MSQMLHEIHCILQTIPPRPGGTPDSLRRLRQEGCGLEAS